MMMPVILMAHKSALLRLVRNIEGVALIEFALSLPILLVLILGGLETANLAMTHMRVSQIAITVADNAGRIRTGIDESNIYELFAGADLVGESLVFTRNGRIVLSSLEPNGQSGEMAGQMINWQRCYGALRVDPAYGRQGDGRYGPSLADGLGREGHRITSAEGTAVMFAEVTYQYTPLIYAGFGVEPFLIRYESAFNVRERTNQVISNTQTLPVNAC